MSRTITKREAIPDEKPDADRINVPSTLIAFSLVPRILKDFTDSSSLITRRISRMPDRRDLGGFADSLHVLRDRFQTTKAYRSVESSVTLFSL